MKRMLKYYRIMWLRHDLAAGLSVFLVALPLCLGVALASGAPLSAGLLSGIIGGLVVGALSGSSLAVSGPAAGLTTIVAASITGLGNFQTFLLAVMVAGAFQGVLGLLKFGGIANYFPSSVIKGMLAAIGIILISKQIPLALGYDQPDFWTSGFLDLFSSTNFLGNLSEFSHHITLGSVVVAVMSLIAMLLLQKPEVRKRLRIPAALGAVLVGVALQLVLGHLHPLLALRPGQLVQIPDQLFAQLQFPDFSQLTTHPKIWKDGLTIGLLATLETLLCIEAIDKLDKHNRITPTNRELLAQGLGNLACGLFGALPLTAVVVRGSANIDAGAKTKLSAITHGALLLLAVLFIPFLINLIPFASLAAVLMVTGYNLTRPSLYQHMWRLKWKQFLPFILTIVVILATDLLLGVGLGILLSVYFIIRDNFKVEYKLEKSNQNGIDQLRINLNSSVTFLNKVNLKKTLDEIPEYTVLTIDGGNCQFIDHDILEIISEFEHKAHDRHIEMHLIGIEKVSVHAAH